MGSEEKDYHNNSCHQELQDDPENEDFNDSQSCGMASGGPSSVIPNDVGESSGTTVPPTTFGPKMDSETSNYLVSSICCT